MKSIMQATFSCIMPLHVPHTDQIIIHMRKVAVPTWLQTQCPHCKAAHRLPRLTELGGQWSGHTCRPSRPSWCDPRPH